MPRVLIIEDDAENRRVISDLFRREDWKVLEATDGDVGLELALRDRPELILCDLLMPRSNGFQVCRAIREQLQPTKIIVVSGRDYGVDRTSALQAGADGEIIILDAGSGIRLLGLALDKEFGPRSMKLTLLISHTHWDHIQGLPFFSPAYNEKNVIRVLGYEGARAGLATILAGQMETPFFPVSLRELPSHLAIEELKEAEFQIGKVEVRSKFANHPGICAGYRLSAASGSIAYFPDNEPYEPLKMHLASRAGISQENARARWWQRAGNLWKSKRLEKALRSCSARKLQPLKSRREHHRARLAAGQ